jgi:4-amino-4-deoxy-L-arabinose transferase-like glycosyltransferase
MRGRHVFAVALAARLAVVAWAARAFPPTADGFYYDTLARRLAEGHGFTWAWPDGAVTYAAHYPIGYPALVALVYAIFGAHPWLAMTENALLGGASAVAVYELLAVATRPRLAAAGAIVVALHPALVPYTAALMTEGVTASLLVIAAAIVHATRFVRARARRRS